MKSKILHIYLLFVSISLFCMNAPAFAAPSITIISPRNGAVFNPGQTINVTVSSSEPVTYSAAIVTADTPLKDSETLENATGPMAFSISVPANLANRKYRIRARAILADGSEILSPEVDISIKNSEFPVSLSVFPANLRFNYVGERIRLDVTGKYSNGNSSNVSEISGISYAIDAPGVATVSDSGQVTALIGGSGNVIVSLGALTAKIPLFVFAALRGDLNGDGVIDQTDLNIVSAALNSFISISNDARDLNKDGKIDALDLRILTNLCTRPRCATK